MTDFLDFLSTQPDTEPSEYDVYPANLWEPHRTARFELGEQMYGLLDIPAKTKPAAFNNSLAMPASSMLPLRFITIDRRFNAPQWSDLGMFLQTFMLLAVEAGLDTCAQEYWSSRHGAVVEFVGAPEEEMLFCGMAIGYRNTESPVNGLVAERLPLDTWATWV